MLRKTQFPLLAPSSDAVRLKRAAATSSQNDESSDGDNEHRVTGKRSSDPKSSEPIWHFDMFPDLSSSDTNPADNELIKNQRNEGCPSYSVDEFENLGDSMVTYV